MMLVIIKYGLSCGIFLVFYFLTMEWLDANPFIKIQHLFFDILLFVVFMFAAMYEFKKRINQNIFHFWQGLIIGTLVLSLACAFYALSLYIYLSSSEEFLKNYMVEALNFLEKVKPQYIEKYGETQYKEQIEVINTITLFQLIKMNFIKKILAGIFVIPILSLILRKNS